MFWLRLKQKKSKGVRKEGKEGERERDEWIGGWMEWGRDGERERVSSFLLLFWQYLEPNSGPGVSLSIYILPFSFMPSSRAYLFSLIVVFYLFLLLVMVVCSMCVVFSWVVFWFWRSRWSLICAGLVSDDRTIVEFVKHLPEAESKPESLSVFLAWK